MSLEESKQIVSIGAKAANRKQFSKNKKSLHVTTQKLADYQMWAQNLKFGYIIDFIRTLESVNDLSSPPRLAFISFPKEIQI